MLWLHVFVGIMAPLKSPTNFKFSFFLCGNDGIVTLGLALALESTMTSMLPIDIVVVAFDPHASSPSSNTINIDIEIDEPRYKIPIV
jgi:hypothetical protein